MGTLEVHRITLTDGFEHVESILKRNLELTRDAREFDFGLQVEARLLQWGSAADLECLDSLPDTIIGSDLFYNSESVNLLFATLHNLLRPVGTATEAILGMKNRWQ